MRHRTGIALLLGAWLAGTLFMWAVATQNFRLVNRLLASPSPQITSRLAPSDTRLLMRYQASEVNRLFFDRWGWVQVCLGVILLSLVYRATPDRPLRLLVLLMLLAAAAAQFYVVPETIRLGRLLDFAQRTPPPPEAAPFWRLHTAYTVLDMLKFLLGIAGAVRLLARPNQ